MYIVHVCWIESSLTLFAENQIGTTVNPETYCLEYFLRLKKLSFAWQEAFEKDMLIDGHGYNT